MRIAVLVPVLSARDAVGTDALEMTETLRRAGHEVELFAETLIGIDQAIMKPKQIADFLRSPSDILIYHFSFGWPAAIDLLRKIKARRIVKYHNITPPEFFRDFSPEHAAACTAGRKEIAAVVGADCELYLADSEYNLQELVEHGLAPSKGQVLAPFNRLDHLLCAEADLEFLDRYGDARTNILMVGRMAPNKGHPALLDAFACYVRDFDPQARLFVVGKEDDRLARYTQLVRQKVASQRLKNHVHFLTDVSESVLKSAYLVSDAFMILSEHEGFCVPLAEAMALKVPIVAYGSSAIPGTVADAGLVWDSIDPTLYACSVARLKSDRKARHLLQVSAARRYADHFAAAPIATRLNSIMGTMQ